MVIELVRVQAANESDVVGACADVRQIVREFHAAFAVLSKRTRTRKYLSAPFDQGVI